jgi:hypothetical protein
MFLPMWRLSKLLIEFPSQICLPILQISALKQNHQWGAAGEKGTGLSVLKENRKRKVTKLITTNELESLNDVKKKIDSLGSFEYEITEEDIKIYGYKP